MSHQTNYSIAQLFRLFHTLRHLRLRQVVYQLYYRATGKLTQNNAARTQVQALVEEQGKHPVSFVFLNLEVSFPSLAEVDWNYAANGKLWTYNLNYFEFLKAMSPEQGLNHINAWITKEATHKDGWEPYPLSLRLVSWIAFFNRTGLKPDDVITASLHRQYAALRTKLEYHLGANHLLENALALTLTSHYLAETFGYTRAVRLLTAELKAQYLPDGAHYELSPMYHIVLLDRMLTVYHCLTTATAPAAPPKIAQVLAKSLAQQLGWLKAFATEDGRYAQFNDGTEGIAPAVPEVLQRAAGLGLEPLPLKLGASGYRRWQQGPFDLWIDAADIGPNDIPGHAHADNLTFELHLNGRPVIVNPGISTYEKNARRAWERSTAAHNTVTIDDRNTSDVWGGFRVGRRAKTTLEAETATRLTASHNGYRSPCRRTFELTDTELLITDNLDIATPGVARFHFAHDQEPELTDMGCRVGNLLLTWWEEKASLKEYQQAVGWNELRTACCLELQFNETLTLRISLTSLK